ncbi:hypothetical protein SAMN02746089_00103 [Caldanaerobius fijiensis DSM 17918]|uniref:AAA+ ATPase domain-containing protein n=1 Tax=Caldanaerobius fijiensis DSM 17918 TaxID=1121256 RepID=A0A1M4SR17_9THEO|nr:hypothetical protein SAMN02746089_00103 [Caldanaerobius fijiensis DSM 17918]
MLRVHRREALKEMLDKLKKLIIYRGVANQPLVKHATGILYELLKENPSIDVIYSLYGNFYSEIMEYAIQNRVSRNIWSKILTEYIAYDENVFSLASEIYGISAIGDPLARAVSQEINVLRSLSRIDIVRIAKELADIDLPAHEGCFEELPKQRSSVNKMLALAKLWDLEDEGKIVEYLSDYYRLNGCGIFGKYTAFRWIAEGVRGHLEGISNVDPVTFDDLIGYEEERKIIIDNTKAFLKGLPASNVLLYGERGTGKSSTVKALLNEFSSQGLRMVEVSLNDVMYLSDIINYVKNRGLKFILFFDDLSFDETEMRYKEFKSILEGGIEILPPNVIIYATSNRRHIVKELTSDNELNNRDTKEEKLSLADRFGITVTFTTPDQKKYLDIVRGLAQRYCIDMDWNILREEALRWAMWHNGRSPRSARQFIDYMRYKLAQ